MSQTPVAPQISGRMFLFENPVLLNRDQHGDYGFRRTEKPFGFSAKARAIPLVLTEVLTAAKHYPIIFTGKENIVPLAVVGLFDDINLFVDDAGAWEQDAYVPGYIRRYPFAMAAESGGGDRLALVFDQAFEGITPGGEIPLFADGQPSEATQNAVQFCRQYEADRRGTEDLMNRLQAYDLITGQAAQYTPPNSTQPQTFAQYFGVDEPRLANLQDEKFIELRRLNLLAVLYAQMISLGNWRHLLMRRARRFNLTGDAILKPLSRS